MNDPPCYSCGEPCENPVYHWGERFCSVECLNRYIFTGQKEDQKPLAILGFAIIVALLLILLKVTSMARAEHYGEVPVLDDKMLVGYGDCRISNEKGAVYIPCEYYLGEDGTRYLALWSFDRKYVLFVRKYSDDGTFENVYTAPDAEGKILDSMGAKKI